MMAKGPPPQLGVPVKTERVGNGDLCGKPVAIFVEEVTNGHRSNSHSVVMTDPKTGKVKARADGFKDEEQAKNYAGVFITALVIITLLVGALSQWVS